MKPDPRLIAKILGEHQVQVDWLRRHQGYRWSCSCLTDGDQTYQHVQHAWQVAEAHQAEHISQALTTTARR